MPEVPLCVRRRKPIEMDSENYVVINKDTARYESDWKYAHSGCERKHIEAGGNADSN